LRTHFLEAIFDQVSDAVVLYDNNLQIVGINEAAEGLFGMVTEEIIGQKCQDLFHCSPCKPLSVVRQVGAESTGLHTGTFNLHVKNGRQRTVVIRTVEIRDSANVIEGVAAMIKDITEESPPALRKIVAESQAMRDLLAFVRRIAMSKPRPFSLRARMGPVKT